MKRQRVAVVLVLVAVLAPLAGLLIVELRLRERLAQRPPVGAVFPPLQRSAHDQTPLASVGKPQVVVFAKASCGNCDRTIATLVRLAVKEDLDLVAVVAGSAVAGTNEGAFRVIPDPDGTLSKHFGVISVPLVFVLDRHSRIQTIVTGERPEAVWRSVLVGPDYAP